MPLISIRLIRRAEPTTREQEATLIAGVTKLMQDVLDELPQSVVVIIDEIDPDNWGEVGESFSVLRQRRAAA